MEAPWAAANDRAAGWSRSGKDSAARPLRRPCGCVGAKEADVALLQQVVGQRGSPDDARQVRPQRAARSARRTPRSASLSMAAHAGAAASACGVARRARSEWRIPRTLALFPHCILRPLGSERSRPGTPSGGPSSPKGASNFGAGRWRRLRAASAPGRDARTHVIPAEMINPIPGIRITVPVRAWAFPCRDRRGAAEETRRRAAPARRRSESASAPAPRRWARAGRTRCSTRNGRRLKKPLARLGLHIRGQFLAGTELVDQLAMHLALQAEDAAPAAVLHKEAQDPDEGHQETGKGKERWQVVMPANSERSGAARYTSGQTAARGRRSGPPSIWM